MRVWCHLTFLGKDIDSEGTTQEGHQCSGNFMLFCYCLSHKRGESHKVSQAAKNQNNNGEHVNIKKFTHL